MDRKLILGKKEIPASHVYDYAGSNGFLTLLKMHTLGHSLALNSQRYFDLSTYGEVLAGKLKGFGYSEVEVGRLWLSFPRFLPVVLIVSNSCEA